ncbi:related to SWI/SNF complex 60 KDa subunit [Rhynchosporium agropyri]|uniref:Related to SWI/SNF complex 60 kDa subunit n=1 Tax=Rhynchosporium agropyri TaxID=914238 RepID=A0A1E1KHD8_9HELO|nr:related to SWI/SNF complex 60 KDa subunit [Rhynchosporium agropyri]
MQPTYRPFPQQAPQRSPAPAVARRGIGPMVSGAHPQQQLTAAQYQAQQKSQDAALERAKARSTKPVDKNIPEGVEDCIIGDGVQRYRELRELERKLDSTMMRKRLDIQDSVNRNVKRYRTLRLFISNTAEDQPWQADTLDVDAFDFSTNMDSSYRVKIEGRLLEEEDDGLDNDDSDDEDDAMVEDGKEEKKKAKADPKKYRFSHFFKAMTVHYDRNKTKDGGDQSVEWKKPAVAPNTATLPNAADFDQLEFKRGGDENTNITINLVRDDDPERFQLSSVLADILDTNTATRAEAVMGIWDYITVMGLQEEDEKRAFECDDRLRALIGREKGYIPQVPDILIPHMTPLAPIKLAYTIRVDKEFLENPQPTIYDIQVQVDDPLKARLAAYLLNPTYAANLREIVEQDKHLATLVQAIMLSKSKHQFFEALSKNPTDFIAKWLSSQKRDLEVVAGEAPRGGGEDPSSDEWRRGGQNSIWASENVKQSVKLMVGPRVKV